MAITVLKSEKKACTWIVVLDRKVVGEIRYIVDTVKYQYFPRGQKIGGEQFDRLADCIKSLGDTE